MKRESVNPSEWGLQFQMDQGEVVGDADAFLANYDVYAKWIEAA